MKKLIAGNWKMNGTEAGAVTLMAEIGKGLTAEVLEKCDFLVCPPAAYLHVVKRKIDHDHLHVDLGGQDCAAVENGAFTGDISAEMLQDVGCRYVILGHSERRTIHGESSARVSEKASRAHMHGLRTIICVGEQEEERDQGREFDVVATQLGESIPGGSNAGNLVIAYEPVWAIGTGKSATPDDVKAMHAFIRKKLQESLAESGKIRILYGGSVKPDNAASLFTVENVDGALIGGASLKAEQYLGIAKAV